MPCPFFLACNIIDSSNIFIVNFYNMIKTEQGQNKVKRIQCNKHGNLIKYQCTCQTCSSPYLCGAVDCIDGHFHDEGKLVLIKFDSKLWGNKLEEAEKALNSEAIKLKEEYLTNTVKFFAQSLENIRQQMCKLQEIKQKIGVPLRNQFTCQYFTNINGFLSLGCQLENRLDNLRSKIKNQVIQPEENIPEESYVENQRNDSCKYTEERNDLTGNLVNSVKIQNLQPPIMRIKEEQNQKLTKTIRQFNKSKHFTNFLKQHINKFQWNSTEVVFNSEIQVTSCMKFHQKLKNRRNLLFLFLGNKNIIGSYYSVPYPSIAQKSKKDEKSFIFIFDESLDELFTIFKANPQSKNHITVSQRLLICQGNTPNVGDGLRTFKPNFESLAYYLPSLSFNNTNSNNLEGYHGVLKIQNFCVLQLNI